MVGFVVTLGIGVAARQPKTQLQNGWPRALSGRKSKAFHSLEMQHPEMGACLHCIDGLKGRECRVEKVGTKAWKGRGL